MCILSVLYTIKQGHGSHPCTNGTLGMRYILHLTIHTESYVHFVSTKQDHSNTASNARLTWTYRQCIPTAKAPTKVIIPNAKLEILAVIAPLHKSVSHMQYQTFTTLEVPWKQPTVPSLLQYLNVFSCEVSEKIDGLCRK